MSDPNPAAAARLAPLALPFRVGAWLAEPAWNRIARDSRSVTLEPRVMRLLATLAAAPNEPMTRQDLLDTVWPGMLVNEEALSRAISQLRRAFDDDPRQPRYIQTIHKGGYSLIARVGGDTCQAHGDPAPLPLRSNKLSKNAAIWLFLLVLCVAAAFVYHGVGPTSSAERPRSLTPLTTGPGREIDPAISPDGKRVAYIASVDAGFDLFVLDFEGGSPVRLTTDPLVKGHPVWSPTGSHIAFVGAKAEKAAIYLLSLKDRKTTKLVDLPSWSFGLDWSPDGKSIAYSDAAPGEAPNIVLLDIASRSVRIVADDPSSSGDVKPAFSRDGKRLAFLRNGPLDRQIVVIADLMGKDVRMLAASPGQIRGMDWQPDGRAVIFSARNGSKFGLWRLSIVGGATAQAIPTESGDLFNPSISRTGRLVLEMVEQDRDIWIVDARSGRSRALIRSTLDDYDPAFSPDNGRIAFVSERSGSPEIWITSVASSNPVRITDFGGPRIGQPSWSRDGTRLAFTVDENGSGALHVAGVRMGKPARILRGRGHPIPIGWLASNELVILQKNGDQGNLERVDVETGRKEPLSGRPISLAATSHDGRFVYALSGDESKIQIIAAERGMIRQFRLPPNLKNLVAMQSAGGQLYLFQDALGVDAVFRMDLATGAIGSAAPLDRFRGGSLSLSSDGASLAYTRSRETGNDLSWMSVP